MPRRFSLVKLDPESANSLASTPDPIQRGPDDVGGIVGQRKLSEPPSGRQSSQVVINSLNDQRSKRVNACYQQLCYYAWLCPWKLNL